MVEKENSTNIGSNHLKESETKKSTRNGFLVGEQNVDKVWLIIGNCFSVSLITPLRQWISLIHCVHF